MVFCRYHSISISALLNCNNKKVTKTGYHKDVMKNSWLMCDKIVRPARSGFRFYNVMKSPRVQNNSYE